jgi:hypothetical protein
MNTWTWWYYQDIDFAEFAAGVAEELEFSAGAEWRSELRAHPEWIDTTEQPDLEAEYVNAT